jgi:hypothetical protein
MIYQYSPRLVRGFCFSGNICENCAKDEAKVLDRGKVLHILKMLCNAEGNLVLRVHQVAKGKSMKKVSATLLLTALLLVGGGTAAHAAKSGNWPDSGSTTSSGNWPDSTYTAA